MGVMVYKNGVVDETSLFSGLNRKDADDVEDGRYHRFDNAAVA